MQRKQLITRMILKMMKTISKILVAAALILGPSIGSFAQTGVVSGSVIDENGQALSGALVVVTDSKTDAIDASATTDPDGKYTIRCKLDNKITIHFMGYAGYSELIGGRTKINVQLQPEASQSLDEVVVIGYGEVKKSDLTGSVTSVKMGDIRTAPVQSVDQALQGRIAGADIMSTSGEPGATTSIRIRGSRSITASNEPLIVVDGVLDAVSDINDISPADIESISVLKDASSTAIYGARGANGVILITTKGSTDTEAPKKPNITFKADAGISMLPKHLDLMNATEFALYLNDYRQWSAGEGVYSGAAWYSTEPVSRQSYKDPFSKGAGTNWEKEVSRIAPYQNYTISINGGQGKSKYYAAITYNDNEGIIKKSGEQKLVGTINASTQLFKWLNVSARLRYTYRKNNPLLGSIGGTNIYQSAVYLTPLIDPHDSYNALYGSGTRVNNPVVAIENDTYYQTKSTFNANLGAEATIVKGLKYKTLFSYTRYDLQSFRYNPSTLPAKQDGEGGDANRGNFQSSALTWDNTLTYVKSWDKVHNFDAMAGFTGYKYNCNSMTVKGTGYMVDDIKWNNLGAVQDKNTYNISSYTRNRVTMSVFGRINYNYRKRYYITVTARTDGASNFAENHKWGFFPSAALRWNISAEPFMASAGNVDELSLKFSAGRSGNDAISPYQSLAEMTVKTDGYLFGGLQPASFYPSRIAAQDLTWEKTDMYNLALTGSFFNSRLNFTAEVYYAYTTDLLLKVQVPLHTGYEDRWSNIGITSNRGVELSIDSRNIVRPKFSWTTAFTISHNTQRVEDIGGENYISMYDSPTNGYMIYGYQKGYPLNSIWGFEYAGVWHSKEEIERAAVTHSVAAKDGSKVLGATIYVDVNHDGTVDQHDLCYLGTADPIIYGGLQNNFRIGNFNIGVYFTYSLGGKVFNYSELYAGCRRTNQYRYMLNAYHPILNPDSNLPRAGVNDSATLPSTFQVHDASYLRLKNVSIAYTFRFKKVMRDLTLSLNGENLYLFSNYNGYDPDVSDGSNLRRLDLASYPKARTIVFSLQFRY